MIAAGQSAWEQVGIISAAVVSTITAMTLLSKLRVVRWVLRQLIGDPIMEFVQRPARAMAAELAEKVALDTASLREQTDSIQRTVEDTHHIVNYHLGPNGTTRPIHVRLQAVEDRLPPPSPPPQ